MKPVRFHPIANREVARAYRWYADESETAAERFAQEIDRVIENISETPERFPAYLLDTQRFILDRFPYLIVYRELRDNGRVIAVAHAKRRPGYWAQRLK